MINAIKKTYSFLKFFGRYLYEGWQSGLSKAYAKAFVFSYLMHLDQFKHLFYHNVIPFRHTREPRMDKLRKTMAGLHSLLPFDSRFSYSVLIQVNNPKAKSFERCLESVFNQTTDSLELIIGAEVPLSAHLQKVIAAFQQKHPGRMHLCEDGNINHLARIATGNFLFIMGQEDWIRPDLLFRYEQTLRIFPDPENRVLYCNSNKITEGNCFVPLSEKKQPEHLHFPYFFSFFSEEGLMIPKKLWDQVHGIKSIHNGPEYEDLLLQLDLAGAHYQHVPFALYSVHVGKSTTKSQSAFVQTLQKYTDEKTLGWNWENGYLFHTARATPPLKPGHSIQVVIPYKDQKELTLKCIEKVLQQKDINFKITAVNNHSEDPSIAKAIEALGGEVIYIDEPFNYSRLNNLAVKHTKTATNCDLILFLNNDVELDSDAVSEMVRWIDQPQIGMVGCRLNFPDGRLQHGGVTLENRGDNRMHWGHIERLLNFDEMNITKKLGLCSAVTAACALVKKKDFLAVGGFDETWYPIGYSDTNLAVKLGNSGLKCFYTPYAVGVHHESVSRKDSFEDYENSWWLHNLLINK